MAKRALIPGTFDPFTVGHLELVKIAASLFDEVVVCIFVNPEKKHLFNEEARLAMIRTAVADFPCVRVDVDHGYTADYAERIGADFIVRGIRNETDAGYELPMADFNRRRTGVKTLLIPSPEELASVSSTRVREELQEGKNAEALVPDSVRALMG